MFGSFNEFIKHFPIHFCRLFLSQLKEYLPRLDIFLKKIGHFHYKKERISHVFHCYVIGAKTIIILFLNGKIWFRNRYYLGSLKNNIWCEIVTIWDSEQQHLVQNHTFSIQELSCTPPSPSERSWTVIGQSYPFILRYLQTKICLPARFDCVAKVDLSSRERLLVSKSAVDLVRSSTPNNRILFKFLIVQNRFS